jgi:hypothetical protein
MQIIQPVFKIIECELEDGKIEKTNIPFPSEPYPDNAVLNYFDGEQYLCFETQAEIDDYIKKMEG